MCWLYFMSRTVCRAQSSNVEVCKQLNTLPDSDRLRAPEVRPLLPSRAAGAEGRTFPSSTDTLIYAVLNGLFVILLPVASKVSNPTNSFPYSGG